MGRSPNEWSAAWFPVVGTMLGWGLLVLHRFMWARMPLALEAVLWLVFLVMMTGGIHLDGLADSADACYGPADRDERLRRMKDPHIGTMGAVAIGLALAVKGAAFWAMAAHRDPLGVMIAPAWGRLAMMATLSVLPYVGSSEGAARPFLSDRLKAGVGIGFAWSVLITVVILGWRTGWVVVVAGLVWWGAVLLAKRRLCGVTGDVAGAVGELVEIAGWVTVAALTCGRL